MADGVTANYGWIKPEVGASTSTWGAKLNTDLDQIDAQVFAIGNASNLNVASNPGSSVPGTLSFLNGTAPSGQRLRWAWVEDTVAESGGNAGSNISLIAYSDAGAQIHSAISVNRSTGAVNFGVASATAVSFAGAATFGDALTVTGAAIFNGTSTFNGAVTFADPVTFDAPVTLPGVTDGSDAAAGTIGEVISRVNATPLALTTAVVANVTSIVLTPGDWDIQGEVWYTTTGTTNGLNAAITPTSATLPTIAAQSIATSRAGLAAALPASQHTLAMRPCRASLSTTTTYYLVGQAAFSGGGVSVTGNLWARRAR